MQATSMPSGHYTIPITKTYEALNKFDENNTESILLTTSSITTKTVSGKNKISEKLHKQFCHASEYKILKLVNKPI